MVNPRGEISGVHDIYIKGGKVIGIDEDTTKLSLPIIIDAEDCIICPGLVDLSVRFREPGLEKEATILSESKAAVSSGVTTVCYMPDTQPVIDTPAQIKLVEEIFKNVDLCKVKVLASLTKGLDGDRLSPMMELKEAGAVGFTNCLNPIKDSLNIHKQSSYNLELVFLGQVNKSKGVLDLITNFKKLKHKYIRLHIVGVGADLAKAKKLAGKDKRIIWHGWLPSAQLLPLLAKMDVLIVPSLCYENSPTVIYESLSLGVPVLASDIGGVAELIQEGHNGWIFPAGDFDIMNQKINNIYKQRDKLKSLKTNCQQSVAKHHIDKYSKNVNFISEVLEIVSLILSLSLSTTTR